MVRFVVVGGCGTTLKVVEPAVSWPEVASRESPAFTVSIAKSGNVAMPAALVVCVKVPLTVPGLELSEIVIATADITAPVLSCARTSTAGVMGRPTVALLGSTTNTRFWEFTVIVNCFEAVFGVGVEESVTCNVRAKVPAVVGVPEMKPRPVSVSRKMVKPFGKLPADTLHEEYGSVPPVACTAVLYSVPANAVGRELVLMKNGVITLEVVAVLFVSIAWGITAGVTWVTIVCIVGTSTNPRSVINAVSPGCREIDASLTTLPVIPGLLS